MKSFLPVTACVAVFAALCWAETFHGKLVDVSCAIQEDSGNSCNPTSSTTKYGLVVSGKIYRFDDAGNAKASQALKSRADRLADPSVPQMNDGVKATVKGTLEGEIIKVESVEVP
jgi:hypothetical protein